jgi:hypothetical protein
VSDLTTPHGCKPWDAWADYRTLGEPSASYTVRSWPDATSTRVHSRRPCGREQGWHTWSVVVQVSGAPDDARRCIPVGEPRGLRAAFLDKMRPCDEGCRAW